MSGFATDARIEAGRLLRSWSRDPSVVVQSLVFPAFLLLVFTLVLGKTVTAMGAGESIYRTFGLAALVGGMYGVVATGLLLTSERDDGLLARLWTQPVGRGALVSGRLVAEAVRTLAATTVLLAVAVALGLRPERGLSALLGALAVPMVFATSVALPIAALAIRVSGKAAMQQIGALWLLMLFFGTGYGPAEAYPDVLEPLVRHQPMSTAADSMRGLLEGGPVAVPLLETALWCAALIVAGGWGLITGLRSAVARR